jgi:hypothetical protein
MKIADVKRRVLETIERARKTAATRRLRIDEAGHQYEFFLERIAVPVFRQVANVLRAEGYVFNVFTPGGSVRLMSDRSAEDYIELTLDTSGTEPHVLGRSSHSRGRRVTESERPIAACPVSDLTEEDVLAFVLSELEPLVER